MQHLADNIRQDYDLLKGFEDHLRYATDPRIIAKDRREIELQRESLARNQREYYEVVKSAQDLIEPYLVPEMELRDTLNSIQQILSEIRQNKTSQYNPWLVSEVEKVSGIIDDPKLDSNHKLKYSIPIIPLILSYEGEIELKSGLNLKKAWQSLKARIHGKK